MRATAIWAALALAACGGGTVPPGPPADGGPADGGAPALDGGAATDGGAADAGLDHGAPSATYPAFPIDWPQVEGSIEGVLATPRFVAVTFDGDEHRDAVEDFVAAIGASAYWEATTSEYGVGAGEALTPVHLADPALALYDNNDIQSFLKDMLDGTHPEWPAPDGQTIYLLYYPSGTRITLGSAQSCDVFGGYHSATTVGGVIAPYAVLPRCPAVPTIPALDTELKVLTSVTSHELVEAATDFNPGFAPGYRFPPDRQIAFITFAGAETGDMCEFSKAAFIEDAELGTTVQRCWSNAAALAGADPCVPAADSVYFVAVPVFEEEVSLSLGAGNVTTVGVNLAMGETKTVQLLLVSNEDTGGPWTVSAVDRQQFFGLSRTLSFQLDRSQGQNGEKVYLRITRVGNDPNFGGAMPFAIVSTLGDAKNYWFGVVGAAH